MSGRQSHASWPHIEFPLIIPTCFAALVTMRGRECARAHARTRTRSLVRVGEGEREKESERESEREGEGARACEERDVLSP
eukprot:2623896-Pyramimonas_sp.AAC.1